MERLNDAELLQHLKSGAPKQQDKALRLIYTEYYGLIEHMVVSNHGTEDEAADVIQNGSIFSSSRCASA